jgi:hypothetical protein
LENPRGKRLLGRPRHRQEDITETGGEAIDKIHLAQDGNQWQALVNVAITLQVP